MLLLGRLWSQLLRHYDGSCYTPFGRASPERLGKRRCMRRIKAKPAMQITPSLKLRGNVLGENRGRERAQRCQNAEEVIQVASTRTDEKKWKHTFSYRM